MIPSKFVRIEAAGSPPSPPSASVVYPCTQCGSCMFSTFSVLEVTKTTYSCVGMSLVASTSVETWPFLSINASRVRYELDASNWAEYSCSAMRWTYGSSAANPSESVCIGSVGPPLQLDSCQGFEVTQPLNGAYSPVISAVLKQNSCIPLGIA